VVRYNFAMDAGSHRPRFPLPRLLPLALVLWLSAGPARAQPRSYPPDARYTSARCGKVTSSDVQGDASRSRDIVGSATYPAFYTYDDGTYAYFRLRLDSDPVVTTAGNRPLAQFGWGVGLDTDGNTADMEYILMANGITERVNLIRVSGGATLRSYTPTLDVTTPGPAGQTYAPGYVEVKQTGDGSRFGSDVDYFLTIAAPMAQLAAATAKDTSPIKWGNLMVWVATSTNGTTLNGDYMCWNDSTGAVKLPSAASGPIRVGGGPVPDAGPPDAGPRIDGALVPDAVVRPDRPRPPDQALRPDRPRPPDQALRPDRPRPPDQALRPDRPRPPDQALPPDRFRPPDASIAADGRPGPDRGPSRDSTAPDTLGRPDLQPAADGTAGPDRSVVDAPLRQDVSAPTLPGPDGGVSWYGGGGCGCRVPGGSPGGAAPFLVLVWLVLRRRSPRRG
jgi:MYXO-CTERM domain-containing protein